MDATRYVIDWLSTASDALVPLSFERVMALCGVVVATLGILRLLTGATTRIVHFVDDTFGTGRRAGVARRPGVLERLTELELAVAQNEQRNCEAHMRLEAALARLEIKVDALGGNDVGPLATGS